MIFSTLSICKRTPHPPPPLIYKDWAGQYDNEDNRFSGVWCSMAGILGSIGAGSANTWGAHTNPCCILFWLIILPFIQDGTSVHTMLAIMKKKGILIYFVSLSNQRCFDRGMLLPLPCRLLYEKNEKKKRTTNQEALNVLTFPTLSNNHLDIIRLFTIILATLTSNHLRSLVSKLQFGVQQLHRSHPSS